MKTTKPIAQQTDSLSCLEIAKALASVVSKMTTPRGRNATDRGAPSKAGQRPGCDDPDLSDRLKMPRPPIRPSCRHVSDWPSVWTLQLANHEHAKPSSATAVDGGWSCDDTCLFCCMARARTTNHLRYSSPCSPHLSQPRVTQYRTAAQSHISSGRINQKRKLKVGLVDFVKAIREIRLEELMLVAHRRADEESTRTANHVVTSSNSTDHKK